MGTQSQWLYSNQLPKAPSIIIRGLYFILLILHVTVHELGKYSRIKPRQFPQIKCLWILYTLYMLNRQHFDWLWSVWRDYEQLHQNEEALTLRLVGLCYAECPVLFTHLTSSLIRSAKQNAQGWGLGEQSLLIPRHWCWWDWLEQSFLVC